MRRTVLIALCIAGMPTTTATAQHVHNSESKGDSAAPAAELAAVRASTEKYRDHSAAAADGYVLFGVEGPLMGEHWYRKDLVGKPLDLARPSTLQYATIDGRRTLVGVAYTLYQRPGEPAPEGFSGDADVWHVHDVVKMAGVLVEDRPLLRWIVDRRARRGKIGQSGGRTMLTMVHAWIWSDNPAGMFAQEHYALPYLRAGLDSSFVKTATRESAWGVALLDQNTCEWELGRLVKVARIDKDQERTMRAACTDAARSMQGVRDAATSAATFNERAAAVWNAFETTREKTLTQPQKQRLAAMIEHPH